MGIDVFLRNGGVFLAVRLFVPPRPEGVGIVFSHGWKCAHVFDDMHAFLAEAGVTVASLEQRGFGRSTGKASLARWPEDMAAIGRWLREQHSQVWSTGISTGGTLALVTAAKYDWFAGAIAFSPFATLERIQQDYPPCKEILASAFGSLRPLDYATADALRWTPKIAPRPALLVHSRSDQVVPFSHAQTIRDKTGATLWEIRRGNHRLEGIDRRRLFGRILEKMRSLVSNDRAGV